MNLIKPLTIGTTTLSSRLILGTALYSDPQTLLDCLAISQVDMVTVAMRRINSVSHSGDFISLLRHRNLKFLPNTAGCKSSREAILTAQLAREALQTHRIKLEIIGDDHSLYPDGVELIKATQELTQLGFEVWPYCPDDVVICQRLIDNGAVCVMPLASPIGSGRGIQNPYNLELIRSRINKPIIVDAGIGTPSDATIALEMGCDAVLLNTAVAQAGHPIAMAEAFSHAVKAGYLAHSAGRIPKKTYAQASSPTTGKIEFKL